MYKQGEIVLVPFPFTDQAGSKRRPALVISGSALNKTSDVWLVQITGNNRSDAFSVPIHSKNLSKPLLYASEIRCNKILVAEKSIIIKPISQVSPEVVVKVIEKITSLLKP